MPLTPESGGPDGPAPEPWDWEPSLRNVSPAGNARYPELFLLTIRLILNATGTMAPDSIGMRVAKNTGEQYENTDGPDIAQPTGKHRSPDWFLA